MTLPTQRFTQYPAATASDYADATTFLIANAQGNIKQATLENLNDVYGCGIKCTTLIIPSVDVLHLNTTPQVLVPAQGAGTAIEAISAFVTIDYNSATYATNVGLQLIDSGADEPQLISLTALNASASSRRKLGVDATFAAADTQIIENVDLLVEVPTGDPTVGDSDIEVYVLYRVITL